VVTLESDGLMIRRICESLMGRKPIMVLSDEAHHCDRERESARASG
jgi:type III restriction enzyme